ncbi:1-(5-phosphoribosyl)-5-[(5-phosphoribosylamino)methylideneamino]imidazole-4-carboxamide isomerase [Priestia taiwanensis]|uniref:1-(5-phosphoribosyl)-5-[(5-phosphoribosylamino)methylideneamino] imidazole-4-carboxamide isomerase n=1 Tax=Priestia taiwanensis TaxID=1347902 RepID=A0A917EMA1_9BACI|nr:1-(5-phosphoribosyl)-5-[(5-phosphoribosylamino)methylideneamino]imidazole-4-carboxamide isomerase [Priestia taiwanensis]MBM7361702.1 phosphoribosylformimino-5-aminoimidazole carboxamide ribotide isomerase [Priestia taiwanensis]GGE56324.1 1-(5-phosphoribosyl)-5-[(5-phosphoribosylamino) methylideneamino] imidazole-4-carboxamide isomerase [Priestia taiwanensis]
MLVFPAIDLKNGRCVRLYQGDFQQETVVNTNPLEQALAFVREGAQVLHVVDLDGALDGELVNLPIIKEITKNVTIPIQVGGGVRSLGHIDQLIEAGVSRVIIGTAAVLKPELVKEAVEKYGEKIAVGIDVKGNYVATHGWIQTSDVHYVEFAKSMEAIGVRTIIFTDISRDGTLEGPNMEKLKKVKDATSVQLIASGGVSNLLDIEVVKELGVYGVITGKALYDGRLRLEDALKVVNQC